VDPVTLPDVSNASSAEAVQNQHEEAVKGATGTMIVGVAASAVKNTGVMEVVVVKNLRIEKIDTSVGTDHIS
jgi:hypothetical protein